ncbi:putative methyltransferase-like protein 7A [Boleophthalmus pectinirostris]|uniref:putative methyltransferase-like protein 7A n=1 Tax=Boleophthalmus pectinirostris TaxID=150288 RepID=UPI000A1C64E6|nr:putative methyltransferase-like protein 7A [Boleophthalmus pectinirostris]
METTGLSGAYRRLFALLSYNSTFIYNEKMHEFKRELFRNLPRFRSDDGTLRLLEIGCGSGANFQYYPHGCTVICSDPNAHFDQYLRRNMEENQHLCYEGFLVESGERLEHVEDASVDVVVCTLVLCSVRNVRKVLQEVRRVLKSGGAFFFLEHVVSERSSWLCFVQFALDPLWLRLGEGCTLTRATWRDLEAAGFSHLHIQHISAPKVSAVITPHIMGYCVK